MNSYQKKQQKLQIEKTKKLTLERQKSFAAQENFLKKLSTKTKCIVADAPHETDPVKNFYMGGQGMINTVIRNMGKTTHNEVINLNVPVDKCMNNTNFTLTKYINNCVIENNSFLAEFIRFVKNDLKDFGKLAPYYNYNVSAKLFNAFDQEHLFTEDINRMANEKKNKNNDYLTESVIFNNITINNFRIKKLTMKTMASASCGVDPTATQFGQHYSTPAFSYLTFEL